MDDGAFAASSCRSRDGQPARIPLVNLQKDTSRMSQAGKGRGPKRHSQSWPPSVGTFRFRKKTDSSPIHKTDSGEGCRIRIDLKLSFPSDSILLVEKDFAQAA